MRCLICVQAAHAQTHLLHMQLDASVLSMCLAFDLLSHRFDAMSQSMQACGDKSWAQLHGHDLRGK